ncbi:MAG TPA: hypothetical protein VGS17_13575 [Candidatus Limnocylindria bacterium]|nr:hypothetical protein [Candidatus Limnocylindria bacterium]
MRYAMCLALLVWVLAACGPGGTDARAGSPSRAERTLPSGPVVRRTPGDPVRLSSLTFSDPSHGWLLRPSSSAGELDRTADGGETWTPAGNPAGVQLDAIGFIDAERGFARGWIVGDPKGCNGVAGSPRCRSAIYRSSDGGLSWTLALARLGIRAVSVVDSHLVFAAVMAPECGTANSDTCGGDLLRSDDGGASWSVVWRSATQLWDVQFTDAEEGFAVRLAGTGLAGTAEVLHTSDGGASWTTELEQQRARIPSLEVSRGRAWLLILPDDACAMGGCGGYQLWRRDGGSWLQLTADTEWFAHPRPDRLGFLSGPLFADAQHGWISAGAGAGGGTGGVLHTEDGGRTWWRSIVAPSGWSVEALAPLDGMTALILASDQGTTGPFLAKTVDGARTWRRLASAR